MVLLIGQSGIRQSRPDARGKLGGSGRQIPQLPNNGMMMVCVKMCLVSVKERFLAREENGFAESLGESGLPVGPGVHVRQVGDHESRGAYFHAESSVDETGWRIVV